MDYDDGPVCSLCGYLLRGLSDQGTCPEYGHYFDLSKGKGVDTSGGSDARADLWMRRIKTGLLAECSLFIFSCSVVSYCAINASPTSKSDTFFCTGMVFTSLFGVFALENWLSQRRCDADEYAQLGASQRTKYPGIPMPLGYRMPKASAGTICAMRHYFFIGFRVPGYFSSFKVRHIIRPKLRVGRLSEMSRKRHGRHLPAVEYVGLRDGVA